VDVQRKREQLHSEVVAFRFVHPFSSHPPCQQVSGLQRNVDLVIAGDRATTKPRAILWARDFNEALPRL